MIISNQKHIEYCQRYKRVRDVIDGQFRLKQVDLARIGITNQSSTDVLLNCNTGYLRLINPSDTSDYNRSKNIGMIRGAVLFNASSRTLSGLMGLLFRADPQWPDFTGGMDYLLKDADGAGLSLDHQAQLVSWNATQIGRHGLLADMPRNENGEAVTLDRVRRGYRASIKQYSAENIVDYHESVVDGAKVLDLLILREYKTVWNDNKIDRTEEEVFRTYRLDDDVVTVQMYDKGMTATSEEIPIKAGGSQSLDRIPFVFVGSVNNNPDYDPLPLEALTDTNLGHYQESANLRVSSWYSSDGTLAIADDAYRKYIDKKENAGDAVEVGGDSAIIMSTGGSASYVERSQNTLSSGIMDKDELRMVALGAQLITASGQAETAEAVRIKHGSDISVLESISINVADAYRTMFIFCHKMMGVDYDDLPTSLNREFFDSKLTAQEVTAVVGAWQAGAISEMEKSRILQKGKVIDAETDLEEMHEQIQDEQVPAPQFDEVTPSTVITTTQEQ